MKENLLIFGIPVMIVLEMFACGNPETNLG